MKLTILAILVAALTLGAALFLLSDGGRVPSRTVTHQQEIAGTTVAITVRGEAAKSASEAIDVAFVRMEQIASIASRDDDASEINRLNQASCLPEASDALVEMLRLSFVVNQISQGAFDVSHGTLIDLWQIDPAADTPFCDLAAEVQSASITTARKHVGMDRILLGSGRKTSISLVPGTRMDLGAITLGVAIDAAIDSLSNADINMAQVDADVAVRVIGEQMNATPWLVELATPGFSSEAIARFQLADRAIATSHPAARTPTDEMAVLVDPRTGYPAEAFAIVIAPTCAEAQALATAAAVLGPGAGIALIEQLAATEALIISLAAPGTIYRSSGMPAFEKATGD